MPSGALAIHGRNSVFRRNGPPLFSLVKAKETCSGPEGFGWNVVVPYFCEGCCRGWIKGTTERRTCRSYSATPAEKQWTTDATQERRPELG